MAKIIVLKLEIPVDDDVRVDDVKARVRMLLRDQGRVEGEVGEGQTTMERMIMFDGASVKFWSQPGERKAKAKVPA